MDTVIRAAAVYLFLLVLMRLSGKRTLAQTTPFDLILLLIVSEAFQTALTDGDASVTGAFLVAMTMVAIDIALSFFKRRSRTLDKLVDDVPLVLVENGRPIPERMAMARVDEEDILSSARQSQGLLEMKQIRYAVLETDGKISVIPVQK